MGRGAYAALTAVVLLLAGSAASGAEPPAADKAESRVLPGFSHGTVAVEGTTLHYVRGGSGPPLVLLHGWPQTWWEWAKIMPALAERHTVIAFDLPGAGESSIPSGGYDKVTTAKRIREGVHKLGYTKVSLLGHDTGALVAYPYARDYPAEVVRLAVLETPLSGFGLEDLYGVSFHLGLNQTAAPVPERIIDNDDVPTFLGWLFSGARHPDRIDQAAFFSAYSSPARRTAGYEYYRAFAGDAANNQANAHKRLPMPVLAMGAEFAFGPLVANSFSQVGNDVRGVVAPDSGHWIAEENTAFLDACAELFFGPQGVPAPSPELANCVA
ncbi:alpha/beta fold hydrolase [Actinophytocola algeriensis]|uniref:Pimeloyl-ACP methyl ester carboxylesterase n=1 Tax=Actinophytocola algeriensis TaxID=1768010 RepID=A0A7W7QGD6_9PSEU|nr:alpha/beta hydrolase [Actinophytocola algeriensis]MBB4912889.1 pimeloyl-ACP methyl ester carboxylesterase [Actinophytocola algeriensis]MBE1474086.1 pimeloyl-ACP methyl ester carboxylesterase [Actinophytocola algeriensis]